MTRMELHIRTVGSGRRDYMHLLLIGDESESMIGRYLDSGVMYVGFVGETPVAVCLVTDIGPDTVEVKNLAVSPAFRRKGVGRRMLRHAESANRGKTVTLGTGETPSVLRFYESCGYTYSHRVPRFFTDNYPHPIVEEGVLLEDMVYLVKR